MARLCGFIAFLAIAAASALIYQVAAEPEQSCSSVNDENGGDAVAAAAAATASSGTVALAVAQAAAARSWGEAAGIVLNELVPLDLPCGDKDPMLAELLRVVCEAEPGIVSGGAVEQTEVFDIGIDELANLEDELNALNAAAELQDLAHTDDALGVLDFAAATVSGMCPPGLRSAIASLACTGLRFEDGFGGTATAITASLLAALVKSADAAAITRLLSLGLCPAPAFAADTEGDPTATLTGPQLLQEFGGGMATTPAPPAALIAALQPAFPWPRSSRLGAALGWSQILVGVMNHPGGADAYVPPAWLAQHPQWTNGLSASPALRNFVETVATRKRRGYYRLTSAVFRQIAAEVTLPVVTALLSSDRCRAHMLHSADVRTNRTALHIAAEIGDAALVTTLLNAGADPRGTDVLGWTPMHMAALGGHTAAYDLLAGLPTVGPELAQAFDWAGRTPEQLHLRNIGSHEAAPTEGGGGDRAEPSSAEPSGGWPEAELDPRRDPRMGGHACTGTGTCVPVVNLAQDPGGVFTPDAATFEREFVAAKRPALVKGGAALATSAGGLTQEHVVAAYGDFTFQVSAVPYSGNYGTETMRTATLAEFVRDLNRDSPLLAAPASPACTADDPGAASCLSLRDYILSELDDDQLARMSNVTRGVGSLPFLYQIEGLPRHPPQLFLGPPGSSSPMHWHTDAVNMLAYGRKHWFLVPPEHASFDTTPGPVWIATVAPALRAKGVPVFECIQEAGDALYIPHGWGHAVLNLKTSVGFALNLEQIWGSF